MDQATKESFAKNLGNAHKMASNWVMSAAGTLGVIWFALPAAQQAAVLAHLPVPAWVLPILATVIGVAARLWPQAGSSMNAAPAQFVNSVAVAGPPSVDFPLPTGPVPLPTIKTPGGDAH